jgi:glycine/D-amino acid oxidase-like deaminating enzyme
MHYLKQNKIMETSFKKLFLSIDFKTEFSSTGAFAFTKDDLPLIGTIPERPNSYFTLESGGNGTTFSMIAAEIIRDRLSGRPNNDAEIFSFNRL